MAQLFDLHLLRLFCYRQDERSGDEIFLKINKRKIWPTSSKYRKMTEGHYDLDFIIPDLEVDYKLEIELWDYDFFTRNDLLGTFQFYIDKQGGPYKTDVKTETSGVLGKYAIEWKIEKKLL